MKSGWVMQEFKLAYYQVVEGRKHFIIIILIDKKIDQEFDLPEELKTYLRTHPYIDATNSRKINLVTKKLRYVTFPIFYPPLSCLVNH